MADTLETVAEQLSIEQINENTYISKHFPLGLGNPPPMAYGGFSLGVAVNAGSMSVRPEHYLYSLTGCFLGPVSTEHKIRCVVESLRNTRTFSTRLIRVMQGDRLCMILTADFRLPEPAMFNFDPATFRKYSSWEKCQTRMEHLSTALQEGVVTEKQAKAYELLWSGAATYLNMRACPESMASQNFHGFIKDAKTSQHDAPLTDRTTADWYQIKGEAEGRQNVGAAAFLMDETLVPIPLIHNNLFLDDAGPCASLDFALRIFSNDLDMKQWHLIEKRALCGSLGLTHAVSNMFSTDGKLVAQMSQQGILRVKPVSKEVKKGKL